MAEISNPRLDSYLGSSKITPIFDDSADMYISNDGEEGIISTSAVAGGEESSGDIEINPVDGWLPITASRNGSTLTATFHLVCSGIGIQLLLLPIALVSLGWLWGILCLSIAFSWQLYTKWLLVNLHESTPVTGIRYSRFLHLSVVAFGEKLGKIAAIFPTMYLSGGTCVLYIITGGAVMKVFFSSFHSTGSSSTLTGAQCFLLFICIAILVALFFPNLDSLASLTFVGSITALAYCTLLWILPLTKGRVDDVVETKAVLLTATPSRIRDAFIGFEFLALAFRGHNLVLEIQGTLPSTGKQSSRKPMWIGVTISCMIIALCIYPTAIVGYWAYGNKVSADGGMLGALTTFHKNSTSKHIIRGICLLIIINYICAFQIYAMPTFDNLERIYVTKKNKPCSRWVRSAIKLFFGGLTYFIAVTFPFLPRLAAFIGAIGLPVTLVYPCFMWLAIKKPQCFSRMWCLNMGLGFSGTLLTVVFLAAALWSLIANGLEAYFYRA